MFGFKSLFSAATLLIAFAIQPVSAQDAGRTILVLDASGSMWGQIDGKAKITIAQEVIAELLTSIPADQALGLTAYGHRRKGDCSDIQSLVAPGPGTREAIANAVNAIKPKGRTPLSAAVIAAAEELKYSEVKATVILVSDGKETCDFDPCEVGKRLEATGVDFTAHVIGFDVAKAEDRAQLQCLAEETGGTFRTAASAAELTEALKVVSEPPPPLDGRVRFIALEGQGGLRLNDGLLWTLTNLDTGEALIDMSAQSKIDLKLPPGTYRAEVLRPDNETDAVAEIKVLEDTDTTVSLILPLILPEATIDAPALAVAGSTITVGWTGPDEKGDYLATGLPEERDSTLTTYSYTSTGAPVQLQMPATPGTYEIRYVLAARSLAIARHLIEVTPVEATFEAPLTAAAGSTINVNWTGPAYDRDYLSVAEIGSSQSDYVNYSYTQHGTPLGLVMPSKPGDYEIRYVMSQKNTVLARQPITVTDITAGLELPETAAVGEPITIIWTGPDYERDYISVAEAGMRDSDHLGYTYTKQGSPLTLKMPSQPGNYEVRYVQNQDNTVLVRKSIEITPLEVHLTVPDTARIGEALEVSWSGPDYERDYISVAQKGSRDSKYVHYTYTAQGSPLRVQMPATPGDYVVRYVANGSPDTVLAIAEITLTAVSASVVAPISAPAGGVIDVDWTGPDYHRDYVAIAPVGAKRYATYSYTKAGSPLQVKLPDTPGAYEIWYVMNEGNTVLARQSLTVE